MSDSVSRRELIVVSAAAGALGGVFVASLVFTVGGLSPRPRHEEQEDINGFRRLKLRLLQFFSLHSKVRSPFSRPCL